MHGVQPAGGEGHELVDVAPVSRFAAAPSSSCQRSSWLSIWIRVWAVNAQRIAQDTRINVRERARDLLEQRRLDLGRDAADQIGVGQCQLGDDLDPPQAADRL